MDETEDRSFNNFVAEVREALSGKSRAKGYAEGPDGPNPLFEMTGADHAIGEIMYKAVRYRAKKDPEELLKIAAWAFLVWRHRK